MTDTRLSRGARLCQLLIRRSRPRRGGLRRCGRPYLARRLGCSTRTVSRYVAELRAAGVLDVIPPRRTWTPNGWRTVEVNGYRLCDLPRPHRPRSRRHDTAVTPPPDGGRVSSPPAPPQTQSAGPTGPTPEYLASRAALKANRAERWRHHR